MTQLQQKLTLPKAMAEKMEAVRRRTFRVGLGTALVAAFGMLLAAMAAAMVVDGLATLYDFRWRATLTYSAWAAAGVTLVAWTVAVWRTTRQADRVAQQVDREMPGLEERWSTVTTLSTKPSSTNGQAGEVHSAMFQQVSTEAQSWTPRVEAGRVVPLEGLIRALLLLTAITLVLGVAAVLDSQRTTTLLRRFWQPFAAISATELTDLSGDLVVGRGESLVIEANMIGRPVSQASLLLQPLASKSEQSNPKSKTITLVPRGESQDQLTYRLRSVKESLRYRLRAGDGQTRWYEVVVADRPQLAKVRLQLTPPAYMRKPPKIFNKLPRRVTVPEGTRVEIALKPKQDLQSLQLQLGADSLLPLTADSEGWYRWETTLTKDITFQPLLTEQHGLGNRRPPTCEIKCRPDRPPVVKILTPNNQMAVRPDETIPITFVASDDVGIHFAELVVYDESQKVDGKPRLLDTISVPLGDQQGAEKVKATVELDLSKYKTAEGSELSFSIRVHEDRGQEPVAVSSSHPISEMDPLVQNLPAAKSPEAEKVSAKNDSMTKSIAAQQTAPDSQGKDPVQEVEAAPATESAEQPVETEGMPSSLAENKTPPSANTTMPNASSESSETNGETTTKRQSLNTANASTPQASSDATEDDAAEDIDAEDQEKQPAKPTVSSPAPQTPSENPSSASAAANPSEDEQTEQPQQQAGAPRQKGTNTSAGSDNPQPSTPSNNSPAPDNPMPRRSVDVDSAQSSSSQRMQLKIDQWAGSYDGQQRKNLELTIAPQVEELDRALEKAQLLARSVLEDVDVPNIAKDKSNPSVPWVRRYDRDLRRAVEQIEIAIKIAEDIEKKTYDTPYAFIGLQLSDIQQAHIDPARRDFWKSLQTKDRIRIESIRNGSQHTARARELLVLLTQRFERTKIEYAMAGSVEKIKKMYRVFAENSMSLLRPGDDTGSRYNRKMAEFDLDEEYLKRLEEVLEMRAEMRAELARILAEDPRLLRRYLDAQRNRQTVLRNDLARLLDRQSELEIETRAWGTVEESMRPKLATLLLRRHIESAQDLARTAANLHDRFETWSPLGKEVEDADFQEATQVLQEIATATQELSADGLQFVAESSQVKKIEEEINEEPEATELEPGVEDKPAKKPVDLIKSVEQISSDAQQLYQHFTQLEILLRRIGNRPDRPDIAYFAANRILETRRLIEQTSAWIRQLKQQQAGNYHRSAEVAQYRLATETDLIAGKLADLEQRMAGLLQSADGTLPQAIAEKARDLLAALDEQAAPNQMAAVFALRRNKMPRAISRQKSAVKALELAGKLYDEMIEASIKELDKLPVEDPIASLLDDPTLDELLRGLEQEVPIEELLGIPRRPSNLQIMSDWLRPGGDNGMITGGGKRQGLMRRMQQQQQIRQRQLDRAYRRAIARALKEAEAEDLVQDMPKRAHETADWNQLASELEDDLRQRRDKAPPERYRRAIEQYFRQVSGGEKD